VRIVPSDLAAVHAVLRAIRIDLKAAPPGLVLVACSGGPDSLALAGALAEVSKKQARAAGAVIIDHGLQPGSAEIAELAAAKCRELGLGPVVVRRVKLAQGQGDGPEAVSREARYGAFAEVVAEHGAAAVLLGHSLDDQAETVLLGLARGSGVRSLAGMSSQRGLYRRPFLSLPRETLALAADYWQLDPWQDPHNRDPRYQRVRVRDTILPLLEEQLGPGIVSGLARTARLARADADALDALAQSKWEVWLSGSTFKDRVLDREDESLPIDLLAPLPQALRTRLVRIWLSEIRPSLGALSSLHLLQIDRFIADWRGQGAVALPSNTSVSRVRGHLTLEAGKPDLIALS
jgi:tRNA(Ile)-lysidine synthase